MFGVASFIVPALYLVNTCAGTGSCISRERISCLIFWRNITPVTLPGSAYERNKSGKAGARWREEIRRIRVCGQRRLCPVWEIMLFLHCRYSYGFSMRSSLFGAVESVGAVYRCGSGGRNPIADSGTWWGRWIV